MNILLLSRYGHLGASSRLRTYQFLPYLQSKGFNISIAPLLSDQYLEDLYAGRGKSYINILKFYYQRLLWIRRAVNFDLVWLEKEFLPWLPSWFELKLLPKNVRLIVDYDDAVFHQYDRHSSSLIRKLLGRKIDAVMCRADIVVAGNEYLAQHAKSAGAKQVEIIPTVVDTLRYTKSTLPKIDAVTIGWIGSPATAHYLHLISSVMDELVQKKNVRFVAVGANANQLVGLPVSAFPWSEADEVELIQQFDIGIMPLPDEAFARGKCGYKLIQYMACGKPVVATPVGANAEIVRNGIDGFWATLKTDWVTVLTRLIDDPVLRARMGEAGRERVVNEYSLDVAAPQLEHLLRLLRELPS